MTALALRADWPAPPGVQAWASLRGGGVSTGPYASLNLGGHVGDAPAAVAENRARLSAALSLPAEPSWLQQVHGSAVVDLDRAGPGRADGAVTARPGRVCAVLTADCLPVLLCDRGGGRVGIAHAGWRGLAAGVLQRAVGAMCRPPAELLAWLGPAIGAAAYEVGGDVRQAFAAQRAPGLEAGFVRNARGRWQADLYALARAGLGQAGVTAVYGGGFCTHDEAGRFFSHRREAPCGRMAALIWLDAGA